jgi:hypothetical protein
MGVLDTAEAIAADLVAGAQKVLGNGAAASEVSDLVGVPATELQAIVAAAGGVMPALAELKSGDKVKVTDGIFALATSAEQIAVIFDPALAPVETITRVAAVLAELAVKYGKPGTFAGAAGNPAAADGSDDAD